MRRKFATFFSIPAEHARALHSREKSEDFSKTKRKPRGGPVAEQGRARRLGARKTWMHSENPRVARLPLTHQVTHQRMSPSKHFSHLRDALGRSGVSSFRVASFKGHPRKPYTYRAISPSQSQNPNVSKSTVVR